MEDERSWFTSKAQCTNQFIFNETGAEVSSRSNDIMEVAVFSLRLIRMEPAILRIVE